ncbi:MAG: putative Ig domain-containing protein [Gammaproteobacteria bacterium]|nr:putative Ig domain-containing protein [Gammaproteobacteria bacterium]
MSVNDSPLISGTPLTTIAEDASYSFTVTSSDVDLGDSATYFLQNHPGWMSINASTGVVSGVPTNADVGSTTGVIVGVRDTGAAEDTLSFDVTVTNTNDAPVITNAPNTSAPINVAYSYIPTVTDPDVGDSVSFSHTASLPAWLSFNASSGELSGTPTLSDVGSSVSGVMTVTDAASATGTVDINITVSGSNSAPVISGTPLTTIAEDASYSFTVTSSDVDLGDSATYFLQNHPGWMSINASTGVVSGVPTNADVGSTAGVIVGVRDTGAAEDTLSFDVTVTNTNDAPVISGTPAIIVSEDVFYSFTPAASDADVGDALSFIISNKPGWASFDIATGTLSGTPANADVGTTEGIVIGVSDGDETASLNAFNLTVTNTNDAPVISNIPNTSAPINSAYSYIPIVDDPDVGDTRTFTHTASLPAWLNFNPSTGELSGTPTLADVSSSVMGVMIVTDAANAIGMVGINITVTGSNSAPVISGTPLTMIAEDASYSFTVTSSDVDLGDSATYFLKNNPDWMSINASTGVVTGVPANSDVDITVGISVGVRDSAGAEDALTFTVTVTNTNDVPVITSSANLVAVQGTEYSYTVTASDIDAGDTLIFSAPIIPGWLSFDRDSHVLSGTPDNADVGPNNVTLRVNDGTVNVNQSFTISVSNINDPPVISGTPATEANEGVFYSFTPTASDPDAGDTLLFSIVSKPGWASFNTGTGRLSGTPSSADVGTTSDIIIRVSDGIATASLAGFDLVVVDNNPPVIILPPEVTVNANGLFTRLDFGEASAEDSVDGVVKAQVVNVDGKAFSSQETYLEPGKHTVTWSATDAAGNTGTAIQSVNVIPLVEFSSNQLISEGAIARFRVVLNGPAVNYPVTVPYTVSGSATADEDHNLDNGVITITSSNGTEKLVSVNIIDDGVGDDNERIVITMGDPDNAVKGSQVTHVIDIVERNIAPSINLNAEQGSGNTNIVSQADGLVFVTATVSDPDSDDVHSFDWSATDNNLVDIDVVSSSFSFDPLDVAPGIYKVRLEVSDGSTTTDAEMLLKVLSSIPSLTSDDSDGDGINDENEGYGDSDNDRIPDYLDAISARNVLQLKNLGANQYLMETETGLSVLLGDIAFQAGASKASVSTTDLANYVNDALARVDEYSNVGGLFDFSVTNLAVAGQSIKVVLPQLAPIPVNAVYRKRSVAGWQDFVEDNKNMILSAPGNPGYCPPPGNVSYVPGLIAGYWCVQLIIEDGGDNDADGRKNYRVSDPGGVAQSSSIAAQSSATDRGVKVTSSGGILNPILSVVLLLIYVVRIPIGGKHRLL